MTTGLPLTAITTPPFTGVPLTTVTTPLSNSVPLTAITSLMSTGVPQVSNTSLYCPTVFNHLLLATGSIFLSISRNNQSGGQVIANGTVLNFSINTTTPNKPENSKAFVLKLKTKQN